MRTGRRLVFPSLHAEEDRRRPIGSKVTGKLSLMECSQNEGERTRNLKTGKRKLYGYRKNNGNDSRKPAVETEDRSLADKGRTPPIKMRASFNHYFPTNRIHGETHLPRSAPSIDSAMGAYLDFLAFF